MENKILDMLFEIKEDIGGLKHGQFELKEAVQKNEIAIGENSVAIKGLQEATQENSVAIKGLQEATQENSVAIKGLQEATQENSVAIQENNKETKELKNVVNKLVEKVDCSFEILESIERVTKKWNDAKNKEVKRLILMERVNLEKGKVQDEKLQKHEYRIKKCEQKIIQLARK